MSPWLSDLLLRSQSDERLIALSHLGHKRAFELIVERYRRPLTAYARRIDPNRADDLVQQTFLAALSSLQAGAEVRHLRGWLYEILRNQARREYASSPVLMELAEADSVTESAEQVAERRMLAVDALGAVAELPARQHDAMVQMAFHGLSRAEVAESMGLSEGAVRQLVHRARAAVRTAVTAITPMPVLRWLYTPRSGSGLTEAALGAGTASGAGIALKVSVGAIVAGGVVAGGVFSAVAPHHRAATRLASRSQVARIEPAGGGSGGRTNPPTVSNQSGVTPRRGSSGLSGRDGGRAAAGRARFTTSHATATVRGDGHQGGSNGGSGSNSTRGGDGRSSSGSGPGDGGSGSSGTGSGDHRSGGSDGGGTTSGSGGSDGGGTTSGGGGSDGGGPGPSGSSGSGGSDGGGVAQPVLGTSGDDGLSSGGDGGPVSSGGPGPSSGGDGGGSTSSGSDSGLPSGTSSGSSTSSDGGSGSSGSGSSGSGSSGSGSGFPSSDGH